MNYINNYYSYVYNGATLTNGGTIDFQGDGGFYPSTGSGSVTNNGTIKKSAGTGQGGIQIPLTADSGSQVQVQSGSLLFGNVTSTGGTINIPTTFSIATLTMSGGTLSGTASFSLTGTTQTWTGGTIAGTGTLTIPNTTTVNVNGYIYYDTRAIINGGLFNYSSNYYSYF